MGRITPPATGGAGGEGGEATDLAALHKDQNLSDLNDKPTSRDNLGLGNAATKDVGTTTGTVAAGDDTRFKAVGTTTGTVAAGDDSRITGANQKSANLSDVANASTARGNLGLGTAATHAHGDYDAVGTAAAAIVAHIAATDPHGDRAYTDTQIAALVNGAPGLLNTLGEIAAQLATDESAVGALTTAVNARLVAANNLSDLANAGTARTNLGLGTAATKDVGTTSGKVAAGDDSRLSNSRTPTAHASSHEVGGSDELTYPGRVIAKTQPALGSDTTNTTSEITVVTMTLPASKVAVGDILDLTAAWDFIQNSGSTQNVTFRARLGSTLLAQVQISYTNSANRAAGRLTMELALASLTDLRVQGSLALATAVANPVTAGSAGSATAIAALTDDLTTDKTVTVTVQFASASASAGARGLSGSITRRR